MAHPHPKLQLSGTLAILSSAFVTASFTVIACGSFAALIFAGPLSGFVAQGIWIGLFTALVVGLIVAVASSYEGAIAIPQDRVAPILALMAGSIASGMGNATTQEKCLGVMAAIAVVSVITGVFLFLMGRFRLGNFTRYIPYPVIGGFLAGSGWLLVRGSFRVMTGHTLGFASVPLLLAPDAVVHWLPGALFGILLFAVLRRLNHPLTVPLLLFGAIGLFYLLIWGTGGTMAGARSHGWLPDFPTNGVSGGFSPFFLASAAPWGQLAQESGIVITIILTSLVSILLTASALELSAHQEIDLNRELRAAGLATFAAGLGGGMVGFHSLSMSRLVLSMGGRSRWVGICSALFCGVALLAGAAVISLVPQFVCGGLLFFLGLTFLWEWVYEAQRKLATVDYGVVLLILAVVSCVGYPEGVGVGVMAAVVMFIHNYSRVEVFTHAYSGTELRSNVERPMRDLRHLGEHGGEIYIWRLRGFIFFGTANHLLHKVRQRANDPQLPKLKFAVLDFRRVTGLDSSAVFSISRVKQLAAKQGFSLIMSQVSPQIAAQIEKSGLRFNDDDSMRLLPDLDHALEWCEDRLLSFGKVKQNGNAVHLAEQLKDSWPVGAEPLHLLPYLERLEVSAATHLIRQSERSESLYFIESGVVTARLEFEDGRTMRLRTMGAGTVVGEVGLFLGGVRTASVVTDRACTVYRLSHDSLNRMNLESPDLALAFHRYLICLLGERLSSSSKILREVLE